MKRFAGIIILFLLSGAAAADLAHDVGCREIAFSRSVEDRDMASFRSFLDGDARFLGATVLRGPEEIAAAWRVFFAADGPRIKWRPQFVEVLDDGGLALTRGPYRTIGKDKDGKTVESWGTFNSVWRIDAKGQWHVVFDAGSPAASAPDEETRALLDIEDDC